MADFGKVAENLKNVDMLSKNLQQQKKRQTISMEKLMASVLALAVLLHWM